jgi:ferritin-like metal-binding protein YciE
MERTMETPMNSLQDLYISELRDLYSAEGQMVQVLPRMADAASIAELKDLFSDFLPKILEQIRRLEEMFHRMDEEFDGVKCKGMAGLVRTCDDLIAHDMDSSVRDAGLITCMQHMVHYQIAAYGSTRSYAQLLGDIDSARLLRECLDEIVFIDKKMTQIAESFVNAEAVHP